MDFNILLYVFIGLCYGSFRKDIPPTINTGRKVIYYTCLEITYAVLWPFILLSNLLFKIDKKIEEKLWK